MSAGRGAITRWGKKNNWHISRKCIVTCIKQELFEQLEKKRKEKRMHRTEVIEMLIIKWLGEKK